MQSMNQDFTFDNKTLTVFAINLNGAEEIRGQVEAVVQPVFDELAPFIVRKTQVMYIRDILEYTIDRTFPGGNTFVPSEIQIAVPKWPTNNQQLHAAIAHEMHHLVRWQHAGYGKSLGEAIITEGLATFYEELTSGWTPPWANYTFEPVEYTNAAKQWQDEKYNHADWFFDGSHGKWAGYSMGYNIAKDYIFKRGFKLGDSIKQYYNKDQQLLGWLETLAKSDF